jgi:hypothetical protein
VTTLNGKRLVLEPLYDLDYFLDLADEDNKRLYPRLAVSNLIHQYGAEFWLITLDGSKRGVVGYFKFGDIYFMEALKDHSKPATGISYSVEAGQLVIDYLTTLTPVIYTCARKSEPAIQVLCKKLGFKQIDRPEGFDHGLKEDLYFYRRG